MRAWSSSPPIRKVRSMVMRGTVVAVVGAVVMASPVRAQSQADTPPPSVVRLTSSPSAVTAVAPALRPALLAEPEVTEPVSLPSPVAPVQQQEEPWTDAWGQQKRFGLAAAEAYMSNFVPWMVNEYVPGRAALLISQISPRSWARGISHGFGWDDNAFAVNMFAHPYQGNMYFNSGRSNGYNYWQSFLFAIAGSYHWECCGETHLPSINDWFNTSIGGAAVGEMLYRTSSMVLDNTATGSERAWREVGAFALDPIRGATRLFTGNVARVYENPENTADRIPERMESFLAVGSRIVGENRIFEASEATAFVDLDLTYGSLAHLERQQPFDFFTLGVQLNVGDKTGLGRLQVRGNLFHKDLTTTDDVVSKLLLVQDFDYINTNAYEFGGQSIGGMYLRNARLTDRIDWTFQAYLSYMIMGAVDSEYSFAAEVPGLRERLREYDFGSGAGTRLGFALLRDGYRWIDVEYRAQYLNTLNGSNYNGEDAWHVIQDFRARLLVPFLDAWGIGVDTDIFVRNSYFDFELFDDVSVRSPQFRIFATWNPQRRP